MIINPPMYCKPIGAYIYIWVSKQWRIDYIGQTHANAGVIARAAQHARPNGTLRLKLEEMGIEWKDVTDGTFFSYELPAESEFLSLETSYRLAVEYLVQVGLYRVQDKLNPSLRIVSKVTATPYVKMQYLIKLAEKIICHFIEEYNKR